jgi:hypothetical protein
MTIGLSVLSVRKSTLCSGIFPSRRVGAYRTVLRSCGAASARGGYRPNVSGITPSRWAGCFRFFTLIQCVRYFQDATFVNASGKSGAG